MKDLKIEEALKGNEAFSEEDEEEETRILNEVVKMSKAFKQIKRNDGKEITCLKEHEDLQHEFFKGSENPYILNPFDDLSYDVVENCLIFLTEQGFKNDEAFKSFGRTRFNK